MPETKTDKLSEAVQRAGEVLADKLYYNKTEVELATAVVEMSEQQQNDSKAIHSLMARVQELEAQLAESRQLFDTQNLCLAAVEESERQKAERITQLKAQLATSLGTANYLGNINDQLRNQLAAARKLIEQARDHKLGEAFVKEADQFLDAIKPGEKEPK